MKSKDLKDMIADLEEYYECAGFAGVYEKVLKDKSEIEIREMHTEVFESNSSLLDNKDNLTVEEMLYEIEAYYECEGFGEEFGKWMEQATEDDVKKHFEQLFKEPDLELEDWEECHRNGEV